ncbi:MAG: zinc ribbon domain-containing protein [Deltaproteobacteria bacterium]|nr:zinc ribbon domain-containing protein [Deltaproteobacteria bacterium]
MPIYEFSCSDCKRVFEVLVARYEHRAQCPHCGGERTKRLIGAPSIQVSTDRATPRIEKRVREYLLDGKFSQATRFADKAASMVKSDKVKRIAEKLHQKTDK